MREADDAIRASKDHFVCPRCGRSMSVCYPFTKDGRPNPFAYISAEYNFRAHVASCKAKARTADKEG